MLTPKKTDRTGKILIEKIQQDNMILLNGRMHGDVEGNFTFSNYRGCSMIDLCFVSKEVAELCTSFKVLDLIETEHFACQLEIEKQNKIKFTTASIKKLTWKKEKNTRVLRAYYKKK